MKAITLRNLPAGVARAIERRAASSGISLNRAVIQLLEEGVNQKLRVRGKRHRDLDFLCGAWTPEADAFDHALAAQRTIDSELWRCPGGF